ncbi:uncharacterized oxidoreductase dhs-27-like [Condylostylus longicornis]|uniref:uncharacterized oxidoreductase dhs-27-like n=1 Tax=Condylostylus longicornis TaxID=2530218 RepID=UPI00244DBEE1|nr:uncharacterized oxidoreductase dhs-27-like [Condylostylus longicornis]
MSDGEEEICGTDNWVINLEWIQDFLKEVHEDEQDFTIKNYDVSNGSTNGIRNLSEVLAVSIDYEYKSVMKRLDLFIKLLPHDPFSRYFVTEAQFDLREIKFYTQILPDLLDFQNKYLKPNEKPLSINVPKCYHTTYTLGTFIESIHQNPNLSPEPPESILVLQDMRSLNYKSAHFTTGLTYDEAKYAISSIAVVHALSIGMKFKEKVNLNEKYPFLFQIKKASDSYQQLVEQGLPQLSKFLHERGGKEDVLNALNDIHSQTRGIIEALLQPVEPMGLITHTDFWCNNLLMREKANPSSDDNCVILDWQMVTYSRPTNDIALLLVSSLPSDIRRENVGHLLDYYFDCLKTNLCKIDVDLISDLKYSREKLGEDYRQSQLLALLLCIGSVDIALGNQEAENRFLDVLEDFYKEGVLGKNFIQQY